MAQCNEQPTSFDIEQSYIQISDTVDADIFEIESSVSRSEKRSNLNSSLETMDISPIKLTVCKSIGVYPMQLQRWKDRLKKSF